MNEDLVRRLKAAKRRDEQARAHRDEVIREAHDAGMSYREIGVAIGLAHSRIRDIVMDDPQSR
jgi:hypothetical protein